MGLVTRPSFEPFGGVYARDWALTKPRRRRGPEYWLWIPGFCVVLAMAWSVTGAWTEALVGLCIISFLVQCYLPRWEEEAVLEVSARYVPQEMHRLVCSCFVHTSWWHLFVNVYGLWYMGKAVEPLYGPGRFLLLYLGGGLGASFASLLIRTRAARMSRRYQDVPSAGASGALYGIVSALAVFRARHGLPLRELWIVLAMSIVSAALNRDLDNAGHAGGAAAGAAIGYLWGPRLVWSVGRLMVRDVPIITWPFV